MSEEKIRIVTITLTQNCNLSIYKNLKCYEKIIYKIFSIFFK